MDTRTTYLGLELSHPLIVGASPIVDDLDLVRRAADAGAAAIVMHSLFEEQLLAEAGVHERVSAQGQAFAEVSSFLPSSAEFVLGPDAYLERVRKLKSMLDVPVIASLNGTTNAGWLHYAKLIEEAGADALELNVYAVSHDPKRTATEIEDDLLLMIRNVVGQVRIPVAVKLAPFYTSLAHLASRVEAAGARGLVLFNRFYQPDIDPDKLDVSHQLRLSDSSELLLRLRWLAILSGRVNLSLGCSGGAHTGMDALKAVMAGAHAVQMVSALLRGGPEQLTKARTELVNWLTEHEYESLRQAQGSMSLARCPNPAEWERGNYVRVLQTYARSMV